MGGQGRKKARLCDRGMNHGEPGSQRAQFVKQLRIKKRGEVQKVKKEKIYAKDLS